MKPVLASTRNRSRAVVHKITTSQPQFSKWYKLQWLNTSTEDFDPLLLQLRKKRQSKGNSVQKKHPRNCTKNRKDEGRSAESVSVSEHEVLESVQRRTQSRLELHNYCIPQHEQEWADGNVDVDIFGYKPNFADEMERVLTENPDFKFTSRTGGDLSSVFDPMVFEEELGNYPPRARSYMSGSPEDMYY